MNRMARIAALLAMAAAAGVSARAAPTEPALAIVGARVLPISGPEIPVGVVVVEGGRIRAVGGVGDTVVPPGAEVVDGTGLVVMPALVDPASGAGRAGQRGDGGSTPHLSPLTTLDAADAELKAARRAGYACAVVSRAGGGVTGTAVAVRTAGVAASEMVLLDPAGVVMDAGRGTQANAALRQVLDAARKELEAREKHAQAVTAFEKAKEEHDKKVEEAKKKGEAAPAAPKDLVAPTPPRENERLDAARRVVAGELPLFVRIDAAADLVHFADVVEGFAEIRVVVLYGGGDAVHIPPVLAERKWSVVLPPVLHERPYTEVKVNVPAALAASGTPFAFSAPAAPEDWRIAIGLLVGAGLPREAALRAVTLAPAEFAGVAKRTGSIEVGKDADLVVLDGDPLDPTSRIVRVLVAGRTVRPEEAKR